MVNTGIPSTNYNQIFDIQQPDSVSGDEDMVINMPMRINAPWLLTGATKLQAEPISGLPVRAFTYDGTYPGCIGIYAYNSLVAPENVSKSITMIARMSAGDSYELSVPCLKISAGLEPFNTSLIHKFARAFNTGRTGRWKKPEGEPGEMILDRVGNVAEEHWSKGGDYECYTGYYYAGITTADSIKYDGYAYWLFYDSTGRIAYYRGGLDQSIYIKTENKFYTVVRLLGESEGGFLTNEQLYKVYLWLPGENDHILTSDQLRDARAFTTSEDEVDLMIQNMRPQAGDVPIATNKDTVVPVQSCDVTKYTVGEYTESLRPLTRRFTRTSTLRPGLSFAFNPMHFELSNDTGHFTYKTFRADQDSGSAGSVASTVGSETWQQLVSHLYRFYAGSFRSKLFIDNLYARVGTSVAHESYNYTFSSFAEYGDEPDPIYAQDGNINPVVECQVPFYSTTRMAVVGSPYPKEPNARPSTGILMAELSGVGNQPPRNTEMYTAAGDDFSFGFLVAPPPVVVRVEMPLTL
jgi:hypothetical protein